MNDKLPPVIRYNKQSSRKKQKHREREETRSELQTWGLLATLLVIILVFAYVGVQTDFAFTDFAFSTSVDKDDAHEFLTEELDRLIAGDPESQAIPHRGYIPINYDIKGLISSTEPYFKEWSSFPFWQARVELEFLSAGTSIREVILYGVAYDPHKQEWYTKVSLASAMMRRSGIPD